jgi:hypothetical protein
VQNLADESRHIDMRWTCSSARGVETKKAARGLDPRFVGLQWRRYIGEP